MEESNGFRLQLENSLCSAQEHFSESLRSAASLMSKLEESFGPSEIPPKDSPAPEPALIEPGVEEPSGYSPPPSYRSSLVGQIPGLTSQGLAMIQQLEDPGVDQQESLQQSYLHLESQHSTPTKAATDSLTSSKATPSNPYHLQDALRYSPVEQNQLKGLGEETRRLEAEYVDEIKALKQQLKESQQQLKEAQQAAQNADKTNKVST